MSLSDIAEVEWMTDRRGVSVLHVPTSRLTDYRYAPRDGAIRFETLARRLNFPCSFPPFGFKEGRRDEHAIDVSWGRGDHGLHLTEAFTAVT